MAFLNTFNIRDINTNISNVTKSYTDLSDKVEETKKRIAEIDELLANSKSSYDELWNNMKNKNVNAESIEALNNIITNKSELIKNFTDEREQELDILDSYMKQKQDYEEQIKYINFYVSISKRTIFDLDNFKDAWYSDFK